MKKLFFLLLLFSSLLLNAQDFKSSFLGNDFLLYKGSLLKVKNDALSTGFTHTFYNNLERCQAMFDNNVIYPDSKYVFKTVKDSLINRIFKVDNIIDKNGNELNAESKLLSGDKPIFVLKEPIIEVISKKEPIIVMFPISVDSMNIPSKGKHSSSNYNDFKFKSESL